MAIDVDDEAGGVSVVTLAGEARDGFLHTPALLRLATVLRDAAADSAIRVVVIRGIAGSFCRGRVGTAGLTRASDVAEDLEAILAVKCCDGRLAGSRRQSNEQASCERQPQLGDVHS